MVIFRCLILKFYFVILFSPSLFYCCTWWRAGVHTCTTQTLGCSSCWVIQLVAGLAVSHSAHQVAHTVDGLFVQVVLEGGLYLAVVPRHILVVMFLWCSHMLPRSLTLLARYSHTWVVVLVHTWLCVHTWMKNIREYILDEWWCQWWTQNLMLARWEFLAIEQSPGLLIFLFCFSLWSS